MYKHKNKQVWTAPRGIRLLKCNHRDKCYLVQWRLDGQRKTKSFNTAQEQIDYAKAMASEIKEKGIEALRFKKSETNEWSRIQKTLGEDITANDLIECWNKYGAKRKSLPIDEAIKLFINTKKIEGVKANSIKHYEPILKRFNDYFLRRDINSISREEIKDYCLSLKGQPSTIRTNMVRIRTFCLWVKTSGYINESPFDGLKPLKIKHKAVTVGALEDIKKLFSLNIHHTIDRELLGRLAIEAFAGTRTSTVGLIKPSHLKIDAKALDLPADIMKSGIPAYIEGLPVNLWNWLKWSDYKSWSYTPRQYVNAKSNAFIRAQITHPHNVLRHSFCSYHIALNKDAARTATILDHTNQRTLYKYYKGKATEADAKAYFEIMPPVDA